MASFVNATEMYSVVIALTVPLFPSFPLSLITLT